MDLCWTLPRQLFDGLTAPSGVRRSSRDRDEIIA